MNIIVILLTAFSLNGIIKRTAIVMVLQSISVKCGTVTRIKVKCLYLGKKGSVGNYLFDYLDEETAEEMEKVRLGKAGKNGRDKK